MNTSAIDLVIELAKKKKGYLETSLLQYLVRAALSGVYIGFGIMMSYRLGESFFDARSPATSLVSSIFFGLALVLIIYGGSELFTGNTMTFVISTLKKETTWKDTIENWITCYLGNLMGAIGFAFMVMLSGLFSSLDNSQYLMNVASHKMELSTMELFFRAILCNWLVCLAVWIPLNIKGDGAKISAMLLLVFAFVASGFEHSVANMVTFSISLAVPHLEAITLTGAIHNLIPVTIGNIIGGGFFVGFLYVYLSSKPKATNLMPVIKEDTLQTKIS
ncbi:formate/nitrite transporter family protein [Neobacillus sp. D3-1R]|uniref:formate/nitrite transporter family protein n=1 Tax=Neobacillus sp. D3-1R TaxID=3445778 RepID=UPI003F9F20E4